MLTVTVKKSYGCGDEGPPEPLSPAAQRDEPLTTAAPLSCQFAVESLLFSKTEYNFLLIRYSTTTLRGSSLLFVQVFMI